MRTSQPKKKTRNILSAKIKHADSHIRYQSLDSVVPEDIYKVYINHRWGVPSFLYSYLYTDVQQLH